MVPITRDEQFLAAAAGEYSGELPEPVARQEHFLRQIVERFKAIADGGGGGADVFVVNYTAKETEEFVITCDKTVAEIYAAFEADKNIIGKTDGGVLLLSTCNPIECLWYKISAYSVGGYKDTLIASLMHSAVPGEGEKIKATYFDLVTKTSLAKFAEEIPKSFDYEITRDNGEIVAYCAEDTEQIINAALLYKCFVARVSDYRNDYSVSTMQSVDVRPDYDNETGELISCNIQYSAIRANESSGVVACFITHVITRDSETQDYVNTITYDEKILTVQT